MTQSQHTLKFTFDVIFALAGLLVLGWVILLGWLLAVMDTRQNGFFTQVRIGRHGIPFRVIKLRTMRGEQRDELPITIANHPRVSVIGRFLRKTKWDELPQLLNVVQGEMSLVGPRPDVPGYADQLEGEDRSILNLRPGITGPASLYYKHEEELLTQVENPKAYNDAVLWPTKVAMNLEYANAYRWWLDVQYVFQTVIPVGLHALHQRYDPVHRQYEEQYRNRMDVET